MWATSAAAGWLLIAAGAAVVTVGYFQVSGTSVVSDQLSYFASGSVGGLAILGVGGVLVLRDVPGGQDGSTQRGHGSRLVMWATSAAAGWLLIAAGAAVVTVGYFQVSGTSVVSDQLSYFASGSVGGLAILGVGGVLLLSDRIRRSATGLRAEREASSAVGTTGVLLTAAGSRPGIVDLSALVLHAPGGGVYHALGCPLLEGRGGEHATIKQAKEQGRRPCRACFGAAE